MRPPLPGVLGELGWHCKVCKAGVQDGSPLAVKAEAQKEEALRADEAAFGGDPDKSAEASFRRGVPVAWLTQWTNTRACWDMPTWQVCLHVMSETEGHGRCRYVEIEEHASIAGAAQVFVSHAWGSRWGNLVQALGEILEGETRVWIDLFYRSTVARERRRPRFHRGGQALPVACGSGPFASRSARKRLVLHSGGAPRCYLLRTGSSSLFCGIGVLSKSQRRWCKGCQSSAWVAPAAKEKKFKYDTNMLLLASQCIDVENAEATNPADKARLKSMLSNVPGGAAGVNRLARQVLWARGSAQRQGFARRFCHVLLLGPTNTCWKKSTNTRETTRRCCLFCAVLLQPAM